MATWVCIAKNENCFHGFIKNHETGKFVERCACQQMKDVQNRFLVYAEGEKKLMKAPNQLKETVSIYRLQDLLNGVNDPQSVEQKTLIQQILSNINGLINEEARLFFTGTTESGKSQTASTILLGAIVAHNLDGFYLPASRFSEAILNYKSEKALQDKQHIFDKVKDKRTKILIIDDMTSEVALEGKHQSKLAQAYSDLIRSFKGLVIITSNNITQDLIAKYKDVERMQSVLLKEMNMKEYVFEDAQLRQKEEGIAIKNLF
jgi:DNA replication protein DnaC